MLVFARFTVRRGIILNVAEAFFQYEVFRISFVWKREIRINGERATTKRTFTPHHYREDFMNDILDYDQESAPLAVMAGKTGRLLHTTGTCVKVTLEYAIFDGFGIAVYFFNHWVYDSVKFYFS